MSGSVGRSVRLFLVDGKSTGLITAEIMNWTGHVLAGPRSEMPRFLARPEVSRTGVYLLHGRDPENPDNAALYIGESDHVGKRLKQHSQADTKGYWERTCVITSKDQNITKAHARYLEARLIGIATAAGRAALDNDTAPPLIALPEADQSDMEFFIEQVRLVLPVLGIEYLRESPKPSEETANGHPASTAKPRGPLFELANKKLGAKATAREIDGEFVVLKGSQAVPAWKQKSTNGQGYAKLHQKLVQGGTIQTGAEGALALFATDYAFSSPSAASAVILGRSDNGRLTWKVAGSQTPYGAWQDEQVQAVGDAAQVASSGSGSNDG